MMSAVVLLAQATFYFVIMTALFRARHRLGIGVFLCALGVMHFLETYLAAVFFIQSPVGLISPGSTVMFAGKLAMILLLYVEEDAETVRQPIYGLLIGNFLMVGFVFFLRFFEPSQVATSSGPDLALLDQMGILMLWGTVLLFLDSIALIMLYEQLRKFLGKSLVLRAVVALAIVLSMDQVLFFAGLHLVANAPVSVLIGNWTAKMAAALTYGLMLGAYARWVTPASLEFADQPLTDTFAKLTYRHRYEDLLAKSGIDALTGVLNRGRFDTIARASVARAVSDHRPISLSVVDVDHFKSINDTFGHLTGDEVLKRVAEILRASVRVDDKVFRYGGEEFVVLCDGLPHEAALANAERLRSAIPKAMEKEFSLPPTVSIGVATAPNDGADVQSLLHRADMRLYEAKRSGRNRVVGNRNDEAKVPDTAV